MSKVLSTKLTVDEADRFNAVAKQQGLSKAGLLKYLVKEYLSCSNEESKTSNNYKLANTPSFEKRQTPEKCARESPQLEKQKVVRTRELKKCVVQMHQTCRIQHGTHHVSTDKTPICGSSTLIISQGKASLAKVSDLKEAITKELPIAQGLLEIEAKTQVKPKAGLGELLFFGLGALGIVTALKRNSDQNILTELNYSGYPDCNEDIAAEYRDMGLPYRGLRPLSLILLPH